MEETEFLIKSGFVKENCTFEEVALLLKMFHKEKSQEERNILADHATEEQEDSTPLREQLIQLIRGCVSEPQSDAPEWYADKILKLISCEPVGKV